MQPDGKIGCTLSLPPEPSVGSEVEFEINLPAEYAGGGVDVIRCHGKIVSLALGSKRELMDIVCEIDNYL